MSDHGITKGKLLRILPFALTHDKSVMALAEAAADALAARLAEIDRVRVISNIDGLPEDLLDILAYDFKVDWWDPNYSLEEKRRVFKSSWYVHKHMGTKAAVETAIRDIYPHTDVQEWFAYEGGEPYHFKLSIDLTGTPGDEAKLWRAIERVNFYKSLRSHLDEIIFTFTLPPTTLHVGGKAGSVVSMGVPAAGDTLDFRHTLRAGGRFSGRTVLPVSEDTVQPPALSALCTGGKFSGQEAFPVPEDAAPPPATTIVRTGGVCTIISNLSKGE